jgi:hypothetical protein
VFVTSGVIVVTLALQGLALPLVVHWARLPAETTVEEERHLAEAVTTEEALAAMDTIATERGSDQLVVDRMRTEYEKHLGVLRAHGDEADPNPGRHAEADFRALRLGLLGRKRKTVVRLRDEGRIDDTALRHGEGCGAGQEPVRAGCVGGVNAYHATGPDPDGSCLCGRSADDRRSTRH